MNAILQYLAMKPLITLLICLGAGFLLGKIKLGRFPNNATLGTIVAAIALNLLIRGAGLELDGKTYDLLRSLFFAMFTFSLGYSAGPSFVNSWRRSGFRSVLRQVLLCVFYCASVLAVMVVVAKLPLLSDAGSVNGLLAGAQTQSSILADGLPSTQMVAYAVSYVIGTLMMILFVQRMAPALLKTPLRTAVKRHIDSLGEAAETTDQSHSNVGSPTNTPATAITVIAAIRIIQRLFTFIVFCLYLFYLKC